MIDEPLTCKKCGRPIGPWKVTGEWPVTVHRFVTSSNDYGPAENYHRKCAPKGPDGKPYSPNHLTFLGAPSKRLSLAQKRARSRGVRP